MSVRTPIQVPEELKSNIEAMKAEFHAKTNYEVIERLIQSHEAFKVYRKEQSQKWTEEKTRQKQEMLQVGEAAKKDYDRLKKELDISEDSGLLAFLLLHYDQSNSFDKLTIKYLRGLR